MCVVVVDPSELVVVVVVVVEPSPLLVVSVVVVDPEETPLALVDAVLLVEDVVVDVPGVHTATPLTVPGSPPDFAHAAVGAPPGAGV